MIDKTTPRVAHLFDAIAPRYDWLNRLLSAGIDQRWRKKLTARLRKTSDTMSLLDIATGTADQIISLCKEYPYLRSAVGVDLAENMLTLGREKVARHHLESIIRLQKGDATNLEFADATFDVVSCSFGLRNVENLEAALREIHRVLRPEGQLLILEFSLPNNLIARRLYLMYFRHILPTIGRLFSRHPDAYIYLNKSVEHFPYGSTFTRILHRVGFTNITNQPLTFGIATLYSAQKTTILF